MSNTCNYFINNLLVRNKVNMYMGMHLSGVSTICSFSVNGYLDKYTFRFNRRTSRSRGKLFYRLLENAVVTQVSTYNQIKKSVRGCKSAVYNF